MVATVPSMIGQFNMSNIRILMDMGYQVDVAADFNDASSWSAKRVQSFKDELNDLGIEYFQIDFSRSPYSVSRHIASYKETINLIKDRYYSFIHTHSPIASAIVRLAAHKTKTKVIYTAHGFHFYDGASIGNWIIFYPIEKGLSRITDSIITINKEDYNRASRHLMAKRVVYVPGIGIDTYKFTRKKSGREKIRRELNLPEECILLLSVGELNRNKNHESVIRALEGVENATYVIVGNGELYGHLNDAARKCNVDLRLMGFRNDIVDFYNAADVYVLPSIREGLNVSLMEAMACGLPIACSRIRGNVDLLDEEKGGYFFNPKSEGKIKQSLQRILEEHRLREMGEYNRKKIEKFDHKVTDEKMRAIYESIV